MTEWRIRLEGSGQSSGTPFQKGLLRSVPLLPLYLFPSCGKKKVQRAVEHVSSAAQPNSKIFFLPIISIGQDFFFFFTVLLLR